jgi:hypothetical protein
MDHQINTILLLLIFTGLVGVLLVVFFMLDRVNDLYKLGNIAKGQIKKDGSFGGLTGKNLWDAMIGIPFPGWSQKKLAELRPRYELVLQKHLEDTFQEGKLDGGDNYSVPVRSDRKVVTLRGEVDSWIPHEFASGIYKAGFALATNPEMGDELIRDQVDMIGEAIFSAAGLPPQALSKLLMPPVREPRINPNAEPVATPPEAEGEPVAEVMESTQEGIPPALPAPSSDTPDVQNASVTQEEQLVPTAAEDEATLKVDAPLTTPLTAPAPTPVA